MKAHSLAYVSIAHMWTAKSVLRTEEKYGDFFTDVISIFKSNA